MKVKELMTREVISVDKSDDLRRVIDLMEKHDITKIPVLDDGRLVGIVTDNKIADKLGSIRKKGIPAAKMHASSVMEKNFESLSPTMEVEEILKTVGEPGLTMLPVVEGKKFEGVITKADLLSLVKSGEPIEKIMKKVLYSVSPTDRVVHARRILLDNDIARLPVLDEGEAVGIIADREIAFAFAALKRSFSMGHQHHQLRELLVKDVMKTPVVSADDDITIREAAAIMMEKGVGCLPIVNKEGIVRGMVTRTNLIETIEF